MSTRSTDIMFLFGAGASVEAEIPASATMIREIEGLLKDNPDWLEHLDLYHHVKSAIYYSAGLKGTFGDGVLYNIEVLVNSLYELERNEEHPLYPFIASWNSRFVNLAGPGFENVMRFRRLILKELKKWMCPENASKSDYYAGLVRIQNDLNYPLRVFSLNYDGCVERLDRERFRVEAGFGGYGTDHIWDWERFEHSDIGSNPLPQVFLYKIHGSIDWKRDAAQNLYRVEQIERVEPDRMEIIFGRDFKLEAADPYLFYAYEFRRFCLLSKLIVIIGYSFSDLHINKMLVQALRRRGPATLCRRSLREGRDRAEEDRVGPAIGVAADRILPQQWSAKSFLENPKLTQLILDHVPKSADSPF